MEYVKVGIHELAIALCKHLPIDGNVDELRKWTREYFRPKQELTAKTLIKRSQFNYDNPDKVKPVIPSTWSVDNPDTFRQYVLNMEKSLKQLPAVQLLALKVAYCFASKCPIDEREDLWQELILKLLESKAIDERLLYTVARLDWLDWWRRYKTRSRYFACYTSQLELDLFDSSDLLQLDRQSYDKLITAMNWDSDTTKLLDTAYTEYQDRVEELAKRQQAVELSEVVIAQSCFESEIESRDNCKYIWSTMPVELRFIVAKRIAGKALNSAERMRLSRFARTHTSLLVS